MAGWRNRIGRMGNHYANEAGLNHTVPMIICWEKPRLLGSLVCSTVGTYFCALSLTRFLSFSFCTFLTYIFSVTLVFSLYCTSVCLGVSGGIIAVPFLHGPAWIKMVCQLDSGYHTGIFRATVYNRVYNILKKMHDFCKCSHLKKKKKTEEGNILLRNIRTQ